MSDGNIGASINAYNTSLDISFGEVYEVDKGLPVGVIANPYSSTQIYAPGDYVIYKSKLYRCIVAIEEPEEFDSEKWVQVKVANEVQDLAENLDAKADKSTTYTKTETNGLLDEKANASDVSSALALKADESDLQALSTTVSDKADKSDVYTKEQTYSQTEVDNLVEDSNLIIADKFDENETYYWGSFVIYEGELYVLWGDEFSGPFDPEVWSKYTVTQYVAEEFDETNGIIRRIDNNKIDKSNPTGTGVLSINRKANTTVGEESVAFGYNPTASGEQSIAGGYNATASNTVSVALGNGASASGFAATAFGTSTRATGNYSQAEGYQTRAGGGSSHSEGNQTTASGGASHAEGASTQSSGQYSHAEGNGSISSGISSHAEGYSSVASGDFSHAEGFNTYATKIEAHAEGYSTTANGQAAHAEGEYTEANHRDQHVFGSYNIPDDSEEGNDQKGNYIEIVGNGYWDNDEEEAIYSNARTLDWNGNEVLAGDLTYNGNKSLTSEIQRLDNKIDNLPAPMIFKGTLGVGGTIQTLPTASASNEGFTYKVITDGTYAGQTAKVGDVFTSNGSAWVYIPSGDEDNDTWRAIKVNGVEKLGNGISSGAVDFEDTANVKFEFDANGNKVRARLDGIYTESDVDELLDDKADEDNTYTKEQVDDIVYNILPDDTASGGVANFTTSLELPIKSLEVDVNAVQESGTPTPSSPKAISGWNAITLDVNGNTEVINLGGTYYGGHFTQDKAGHRQFEVTHGIKLFGDISFSRSNNGGAWSSYLFYAQISDKVNGGVVKCSNYEYVVQAIASMQNEKIVAVSTNKYIYIRDDAYTTTPDFKTANANTQLVYPLETPIIIDLPDGEPIITLNGTNNIYADTGDSAVEYKVSVEQYVSNHSGGGLGGGLLGGGLGGAKSGGSEEEPTEESEETEKTKEIDDPKEETKTIGDMKKLGGE